MESGVLEAVRAAGGAVFGVTSEPQTLATEAQETWETGFPCIGDPHHEIRDDCRERGFVNLFANERLEHLDSRPWVSHPKGYLQPGVLAVSRTGRVLYRWRCRPQRRNLNGAGYRPAPEHVWEEVRPRLRDTTEEPGLDESAVLAGRDPPWPVFVAVLLAHGWFVRLKTFPLARAGERAAEPRGVLWRIPVFLAAWIGAFVLLPAAWVGAALLAWTALAAFAVVRHYGHFQHVPDGESGP